MNKTLDHNSSYEDTDGGELKMALKPGESITHTFENLGLKLVIKVVLKDEQIAIRWKLLSPSDDPSSVPDYAWGSIGKSTILYGTSNYLELAKVELEPSKLLVSFPSSLTSRTPKDMRQSA